MAYAPKNFKWRSSTNVTGSTLYTAPSTGDMTFNDITICNSAANTITWDLYYTSGGTDYYLYSDQTVAADETKEILGVKTLVDGEILKFTCTAPSGGGGYIYVTGSGPENDNT